MHGAHVAATVEALAGAIHADVRQSVRVMVWPVAVAQDPHRSSLGRPVPADYEDLMVRARAAIARFLDKLDVIRLRAIDIGSRRSPLLDESCHLCDVPLNRNLIHTVEGSCGDIRLHGWIDISWTLAEIGLVVLLAA